jgi:hypothetical protein
VIENKQKVLLIKQLIQAGYKDKHICMVAQANQPYVSKVRNEKIHVETKLEPSDELNLDEAQQRRLKTLNTILAIPEIFRSGTTEQDLIYIHVLKFFMVQKEDVYNLYFHLSKRQFNRYWVKKDVDILKFESELINIDRYDYLDLVIDYFI